MGKLANYFFEVAPNPIPVESPATAILISLSVGAGTWLKYFLPGNLDSFVALVNA